VRDDERRQRAGGDRGEGRARARALLGQRLAAREAEGGLAGEEGGVQLGLLAR